ncbi:MAG: cytochrome C [Candidatus Parabeggiatoa sp. nov. 3]|nr:MAG: cytochrome C [Gammaproteobacteria bacterium]RKZ69520.1 MAG: cytochrome C [Gammaproteobacteria bacterium]RKZ90134.1 MAG: cytochrome C [Gammaproteobacteria bacterium]
MISSLHRPLFCLLFMLFSQLPAHRVLATEIQHNVASTADHSKFEVLQNPFQTGPQVTKACLTCHTEAAKQIHKTVHWTWLFNHPETQQVLGKRQIINSFCGSIVSNYARCTSCHIGYGWKDNQFDFSNASNVDCLVCHDTTGTYKKFPTDAGHPAYQDKPFPKKSQNIFKAPDLSYVAQNVGETTRQTCGVCHFYGGGGNGVKHGDLDSSLNHPNQALDVHMDEQGLNFNCAVCHTADSHDVKGSRYTTIAKDEQGIDIPGRSDQSRATCESCHGSQAHSRTVNNKINDHTNKVACQTCHIPAYARGGVPTNVWWDWSVAGRMTPEGKHIKTKNAQGHVTYVTKKGEFKWDENVIPEYAWYAGNIRYTLLDEKIDPTQPVAVNTFSGDYQNSKARIWPFKIMRGKQAYDKGNNTLVITHLFGKEETAYWQSFDWNTAIKAGMDDIGANYTGQYGFLSTTMHWALSHTIAPKEEALGCEACHSQNGRLSKLTDFYMPGRDKNELLDLIGWLTVLATLVGVL